MNAQLSERDLKSARALFVPIKGTEALGTAGICVAVGVVLPLIVHSMGMSPRAFLPMHFPVFLAGILLSPLYAALVGVMAPALSSGFTGYPTAEQVMRMIPELAMYGLTTSLVLHALPVLPGLSQKAGRLGAMLVAMLVAMVIGRLAYIAAATVFTGAENFNYYVMVLVTPAIPGMIAQLLLVPIIASRFEKPVPAPDTDKKRRKVS